MVEAVRLFHHQTVVRLRFSCESSLWFTLIPLRSPRCWSHSAGSCRPQTSEQTFQTEACHLPEVGGASVKTGLTVLGPGEQVQIIKSWTSGVHAVKLHVSLTSWTKSSTCNVHVDVQEDAGVSPSLLSVTGCCCM